MTVIWQTHKDFSAGVGRKMAEDEEEERGGPISTLHEIEEKENSAGK